MTDVHKHVVAWRVPSEPPSIPVVDSRSRLHAEVNHSYSNAELQIPRHSFLLLSYAMICHLMKEEIKKSLCS